MCVFSHHLELKSHSREIVGGPVLSEVPSALSEAVSVPQRDSYCCQPECPSFSKSAAIRLCLLPSEFLVFLLSAGLCHAPGT